jgi:small-conductance mechanosensitive channel
MSQLALLAAETGRDRVIEWLRGDFVVIVMTVTGAYLLTRLMALVTEIQIREVRSKDLASSDLTSLTKGAHRAAAFGALRWGLNFVIIAVAVAAVLVRLNLPSSALVFIGSVAGAGLGFGAQQMVGDVIAGIYIISERQFGVGDIVRVGPLGVVGWVEGRVEEVTLRVTKLRTFDGDLVSVANGVLRHNVNMSRDWSRVLVTVPIPRDQNVERTVRVIDDVCVTMGRDPRFAPLLIEVPSVAGLDDIESDHFVVRVAGRSKPVQQWKVERELRLAITSALQHEFEATA